MATRVRVIGTFASRGSQILFGSAVRRIRRSMKSDNIAATIDQCPIQIAPGQLYSWIALTISSTSLGTATARFAKAARRTPRLARTLLNSSWSVV